MNGNSNRLAAGRMVSPRGPHVAHHHLQCVSCVSCWSWPVLLCLQLLLALVSCSVWTVAPVAVVAALASKPLDHAAARTNHPCGADRLLKFIDQSRQTKLAIPVFGVHDALSAKIMHAVATTAAATNNDTIPSSSSSPSALFISGFGVSASRLGVPDAGILSRPDVLDTLQNIFLATATNDNPYAAPPVVMVDGDTGFGGTANVRRTIHSLAAAGAAAVTIEDQVFPKRCTYVAGSSVQVVSRRQAHDRIKVAVQASKESWEQRGQKVLIVGRTDCRNSVATNNGDDGAKEALERCLLFQQAGADIVYAESLHSAEEYLWLRQEINDPMLPMMIAQVQQQPGHSDKSQTTLTIPSQMAPPENTKPPGSWTIQDIGDMNFELALFGVTALQATVAALQTTARHVFHTGGIVTTRSNAIIQNGYENHNNTNAEVSSPLPPPPPVLASLDEVKQVVGFLELELFESEFGCT
jgi:2-methylisocitrate lyase-like PEP mutase family enzyme